ncbi:MAG: DUF1924 domain-containing protein [Burkholderiaceae bacterium]
MLPSRHLSRSSTSRCPSPVPLAFRWRLLAASRWPVSVLAADTTPAAQLQRWAGAGWQPGDALRGQTFFTSRHGAEWSCASCHGNPPAAQGKHANTGKPIPPLAPAFNPGADRQRQSRQSGSAAIAKTWWGGECSAGEKADVLAYLNALK